MFFQYIFLTKNAADNQKRRYSNAILSSIDIIIWQHIINYSAFLLAYISLRINHLRVK